ncbi:hypothetical protein GUJ93_ZPchr0010g9041 [Zizania palustris]|uniref:Uncharacterized protein n=1 Tax=Zizania palustris TaxID=103762 RepID=A0A8J5W746_ZIZPA|nr:hypothetical protein GUJ93_ZPchr0010g9041 [Zizania palustris]
MHAPGPSSSSPRLSPQRNEGIPQSCRHQNSRLPFLLSRPAPALLHTSRGQRSSAHLSACLACRLPQWRMVQYCTIFHHTQHRITAVLHGIGTGIGILHLHPSTSVA